MYLPAAEARVKYLSPARYDDLIRVTTRISKLGGASVEFTYEIADVDTGRPIAEGHTLHPFVNGQWKPVRVPPSIKAKLIPAG